MLSSLTWSLSFTLALGAAADGGLNQAALDALVKRAGELDTDALVVMKDGEVVLEKWFDGEPRKIEAMSVTKSVVSMAFGRMLKTGELKSLDVQAAKWFPEWRADERKRTITVRHLLEMTSGVASDRSTQNIYASDDFVKYALAAELASDPGATFFYNNTTANLLPALVERITGQPIDVYLQQEVFAPLGIVDVSWTKDRAGNPHGMSGLQIQPRDLAKLAQLMLDGGRDLLDAKWVEQATSPSARQPRYGHLWWLEHQLTSTIDDALIAEWRKGGADELFLTKIAVLKGRMLREDFFPAIEEALKDIGGESTWAKNTWAKGLPDGRVVHRELIGFSGNGWQGQHVVALKQPRLVVVRMREASEGNTREESQRYGFGNIGNMTRALASPTTTVPTTTAAPAPAAR